MRLQFEMTEEEYQEMLTPYCTPCIADSSGSFGLPPQDIANAKWQRLAEKRGFVWDTVEPCPEQGERFFTAIADHSKIGHKWILVDMHVAECACGAIKEG